MPIFISYSHSDKKFVEKLAAHLVKNNAHVWVDTWKLNVGDSILNKVQQAILESGALLVVLSAASVQSEWCKRELAVISPAIMGPAYFREAAEVINAAAGGQPDRAKVAEVLGRHGMTVAAHPPGK